MARASSIGSRLDKMSDIREERRTLAETDKTLKAEYDTIETGLIETLDAEGMTKATGNKAGGSLSTIVVANKLDWEMFCEWARKTKNMHMFQQRVSDPAYRELREKLGKPIPGLEDFIKRSISLRNLTT